MALADQIIAWQIAHGRHDLPWQNTCDPYRVWLSEIMLQQTQVSAVIEYYQRFLSHFPDVASLAQASPQSVMAQWAGLGYYARARNLHACAQRVMQDWQGSFPPDAAGLATLPGIGPSTAAAIAAFCYGERAAILDGNVKRVFARYFAVDGDPTQRATEIQLWAHARAALPSIKTCRRDPETMARYTQGQMDLGATLCTRSRPKCHACPIQKGCEARRTGRTEELPWPRKRKVLPERATGMLIACKNKQVLLEQRPESGIWGGLWSLPEFDATASPAQACEQIGVVSCDTQTLAPFLHVFTHYRLTITPLVAMTSNDRLAAEQPNQEVRSNAIRRWVRFEELVTLGLPAPVRKLLDGLLTDQLL
ncbi:A/G-specific adenine glycosylase [Zwartia sp.]|uniref:A/G-specific adenine glycosylase n=1 Tax=Zwartia sp. TaxID=2978004 RepID=UPI00271EF078|nr:A/G-specific adenine glycosylase [Zwartia sp.]MDO9024760.1 A/G-specific adenine glycosylase [Zwartia sp.]